MTNKEAAKILDPETTLEAYAECEYYGGFSGAKKWKDDVDEACKIAANVLREQEKEPCEWCETPVYVKIKQYCKPLLAPLTIEQELTYELINITGENYIKVQSNFCPMCGRGLRSDEDEKE